MRRLSLWSVLVELVPDGAGIGARSKARRRKHSGHYVEEGQRSSRRRDQARWYQFSQYTPLALTVFFLSSAAFGQQSFRVLSVSPSSGPSTGGTIVTIEMNALPNCPILAPPVSVTFGAVSANANLSDNNGLTVTAPPHTPGLVDLTITACGADPIIVPRGFSYFNQVSTPNPPFRVISITPAFGPPFGGTEVTFKVDAIPFCFDAIPPAGLTFGGREATNVREDVLNGIITGVTPAAPSGGPGPVDVVLRTCGGPQVTVESGFTYSVAADPNPGYEKVLFPIVFAGPGSHGSQWNTRILVYNSGQHLVEAARAIFEGDPRCPAVCGCSTSNGLFPGTTNSVCVAGLADPMGLMFYPPKSAGEELEYHARLFDTSRSTLNAGTEMPVVREREFRTDNIVLLDLPIDPNFRVALRVFNPDQIDEAQVKMTVLDPASVGVMGERIVTLSYPIRTAVFDPYPIRPSFAFVNDLQQVVRDMIPPSEPVARFHLKITPVTEGIRFWAFASITNNTTQVVTTVTPQR